LHLVSWIVVGILAGGVARALPGIRIPHGFVGAAAAGATGAVVGGIVFATMSGGRSEGIHAAALIAALIGAVLVLGLLAWTAPRGRGGTVGA